MPEYRSSMAEVSLSPDEELAESGLGKKESFDFAAEEVLKTLRPSKGRGIEYIGSATSHFQAEPLLYDAEGKPQVFSDWEIELVKNIKGSPSKILAGQNVSEFPKFLPKKERYIARSAELGENMFRFSLDFARLCPKAGEFNSELMADYVKALALIRARGQEPMLAMYHWPMPKYLLELDANDQIQKGGWEHPEVAKHFRYYVENVLKFLGDQDKVREVLKEEKFNKADQDKFLSEGLTRYFLSINEPSSIIFTPYVLGVFPPFKKGRVDLIKTVTERLIEAHDITQNEIKKGKFTTERGEPKVGIAHAWGYFDGVFGEIVHSYLNRHLAKKFERGGEHSDFIGLQYYFRTTVPPFSKAGRVYGDHPQFGDIYPRGAYELLKKMNRDYPQKEIFVTEFGFSDRDDLRRPYWILETLRYVYQALKEKVPVKGMLLWTLVNNFEWNMGMNQKFGLFDESELGTPLSPSSGKQVRGWEAWRAVTAAITNPSEENLQQLQDCYEKSKQQFEEYVKVSERS